MTLVLKSNTPSLIAAADLPPITVMGLYGTPFAGYGLRKLSAAYVGAAVRVRRSSDSAEQDIGFVGMDLDTAALLTFANGGDAFVKTLYDQSGNGNTATQATTGSQPKIVDTGVVLLAGGRPTMRFDGVDDRFPMPASYTRSRLRLTAVLAAQSTAPTNEIECALSFAGSGNDNNTSNRLQIGLNDTGNSNKAYAYSRVNANAANPVTSLYGATDVNQQMSVLTADADFVGEVLSLRLNGQEDATAHLETSTDGPATSSSNSFAAWLGSATQAASPRWWSGNISEALLFAADISANIPLIERNLMARYGLI